MTAVTTFQTIVIAGCLIVIARSFWPPGSLAHSRAWANHPRTIAALARERGVGTEESFVWKLGNAGVDADIAHTLWREIQSIVALHYGVKHFPVRPDDELGRTYLFSLDDWTGYPDDPGLLESAYMIAKATKRRLPKEPELQLAQLRTVLDLARWLHQLRPADEEINGEAHGQV